MRIMFAGAIHESSGRKPPLDQRAIVLAHEPPFRIGEAEFRPATREALFRDRLSIMEPRVMQLLVALHRAAGGVVSKDDLATLCWDSRIVGEDAINRVISRLRAVAERQAGSQFRVETITKVGYRLVPADQGARAGPAEAPAGDGPRARIGRRELVIGGGAVALIGASGIGWTVLRNDTMPREARLLVDDTRKSLRQGSFDAPMNAIGTLRRATQLAPTSAEAWGLLALAYGAAATDASAQGRPDLQARQFAAMNRAFALLPNQADALAAQISSMPMYHNWYAYEQASRAALRHHPNHPELLVQLAAMLTEVGRLREALQLYDKALPYMPLSAQVLNGRSALLWSLGRLEEADAAIAKAFALLPRDSSVWMLKLYYLMYGGRAREAAAMLADKDGQPLGIVDLDFDLLAMQANALAGGDRTLVRKALEAFVRVAESGDGLVVAGATFAAFVGDLEQSFRLLNALYFNRGFKVPGRYFTRAQTGTGGERFTSPLFCRATSPIRGDARFRALTREIGLDAYWARSNSRSLVVA